MKELLLKRKSKFIQYLAATFMFIINHFAGMAMFALILEAIEKADIEYYKTIVIVIIIYIIYSPLTYLISRLLRIRYMRDTILDVRKQAFDRIINMPFKRFSQKSKEVYISNLINDINIFENKFFISFLNFLINIGMFLFSLLFLVILDYRLALGMLMFSVLLFFLAGFFSKKAISLEQEISSSNEVLTTDMANTFTGMEILKLNNIEDKFLLKSIDTINRVEGKKCAAGIFTEMQQHVIRILAFVVSVLVMIYLGGLMQKGTTLGMAGFIFQLCSSISNYLINAFPRWNQMKASVSIYNKIAKTEEYTVNIGRGDKPFSFEEQIRVSNLSFSFGSKQIIRNASFVIEKGKKYLIKGVSGAGKTSLMNLLAMVYDDFEGSITVDGVDYGNIYEKSFYDKVAFIYQDVFLFEDTIRNNITLYKDIPDDQIAYAVKVSGLDTLIQEKKEGLNLRLTENGKNLSGGQRQRISIARAMAKDAEILFVDEGTSSLNEELGREIEKVFLELESTVIAISHRYYEGVSENYDQVIELKNGEVHCYPAKDYFSEVLTC